MRELSTLVGSQTLSYHGYFHSLIIDENKNHIGSSLVIWRQEHLRQEENKSKKQTM
jgi:hypothetical protein